MDNLMLASILSMAGLAILFASILAFADKKLKVVEDPRIAEVFDLLPHANCAACGYVSCHDFAEHVITDGEDVKKCRVLGEEALEKLCALVGEDVGEQYPFIPVVLCAAESENKEPKAEYKGVETCRAADLVFGGGMECEYGCTGLGDCVSACPFGALYMDKGLPRLNEEKCTGCEACAKACPRGIIIMQQKRYDDLFHVSCCSHDTAPRVRQICSVGCIACGICEKLSEGKLFKVADNLAEANYSKQDEEEEYKKIAEKCPTKVIKRT